MNSYAQVLVEISADKDFVESLVVAILVQGKEHRMVSIGIDFEWRPPRYSLCKIFDHMDVECHKKGKKVNSKENMDDESVHIKRTTKGTNQGSTSKYKAGFKFPNGKPILVYRPVAKTNVTSEKASIQQDNTSCASREVVKVACDKLSDSSNVINEYSSRPTNATSIIRDEIDLDQQRNNMNKLMEEEKVLDINTEAVTPGLDDGMAAENGRLGVCFKEAKEAATMALSSKPKLSFGDLDLTNISDSDKEEVFASNDKFEAYLSSVGGDNQLKEEFDFYDGDYADQIHDLPGQVKAFRDFQLLNSGRK
ncbi:hypothetical protein Tco_0290278 [Tanacetum coccineum]